MYCATLCKIRTPCATYCRCRIFPATLRDSGPHQILCKQIPSVPRQTPGGRCGQILAPANLPDRYNMTWSRMESTRPVPPLPQNQALSSSGVQKDGFHVTTLPVIFGAVPG